MLFRWAETAGPVDFAIYDVGINMPGGLLTMEADFFERCWRAAWSHEIDVRSHKEPF